MVSPPAVSCSSNVQPDAILHLARQQGVGAKHHDIRPRVLRATFPAWPWPEYLRRPEAARVWRGPRLLPGPVRSPPPAASSVLNISVNAVESQLSSGRPARLRKPSTATARRGRTRDVAARSLSLGRGLPRIRPEFVHRDSDHQQDQAGDDPVAAAQEPRADVHCSRNRAVDSRLVARTPSAGSWSLLCPVINPPDRRLAS